jgi:hypothetical protein
VVNAPPLDAPLPAEVAVGRGWLLGYRRYPVFSAPWLWRRGLCFAAVAGGLAALIAGGLWASHGEVGRALSLFGHFVVGVVGVSSLGPALATLVRHRRWGGRRERVGLGLALLAGVAGAAAIDGWSSAGVARATAERAEKGETAETRSPAAPEDGGMIGDAFALLLYALLGGGLSLVRYFAEERELIELAHRRELAAARQRQSELDARLGLLQAQVEPHFLFNTLASVRSLLAEDRGAAERLIDALVVYLRATIPRLREPAQLESTLGQQLELCTAYLEVVRVRMGGRLAVAVDVNEALRRAPFPPLHLISLVENAVKHGIEPKRGAGRIALSAAVEPAGDAAAATAALVVTVQDDGVGLASGLMGHGVGLRNVREALAARYGEAASLTLRGRPEGGVAAGLRVPWRAEAT